MTYLNQFCPTLYLQGSADPSQPSVMKPYCGDFLRFPARRDINVPEDTKWHYFKCALPRVTNPRYEALITPSAYPTKLSTSKARTALIRFLSVHLDSTVLDSEVLLNEMSPLIKWDGVKGELKNYKTCL